MVQKEARYMSIRPLLLVSCMICSAACTRLEPSLNVNPSLRSDAAPVRLGQLATTTAKPMTARPGANSAMATAKGAEPVLFEDVGNRYCIGSVSCLKRCADSASACEVRNVYVIKLAQPAHITGIQLIVRETADKTRAADLRVRVNGAAIGKVPKSGRGSTLSIPVQRAGRIITVEALPHINADHRIGVEALVSDVRVFGRKISTKQGRN